MPSPATPPSAGPSIDSQLKSLRTQNRSLRILAISSLALALAGLALQLAPIARNVQVTAPKDGILRVRGLIVEDSTGVERVRLGAPLPDPMGPNGTRQKRQGPISGLIIADAKGIERGGYVTDDQHGEAFFSLDSQKGQEVLFLTNPDGGTNLDLFDKLGNEAQLTVFPTGPELILKRSNKVVAKLPYQPAK